MCTLSWLSLPDGYVLAMNRDERLTRRPGTPPAEREVAGARVLCPGDAEAGGTWLAVNEHGHALALLNRYGETPHDEAASPVSRGLLVLELAGLRHSAALDTALTGLDLGRYRPFTLASVSPGRAARLYEWNGGALASHEVAAAGLLRTSSGEDQAGAERERGALFQAAGRQPGGLTTEVLAKLHRSHLPSRGALSICMHRPDAATQSHALIRVTAEGIEFRQVEGSPCENGLQTRLTLPRRAGLAG